MTDTKRWYQSKTMWGLILTFLMLLLEVAFGVVPEEVPAEWAPIVTIIISFISRFVATKRLTL